MKRIILILINFSIVFSIFSQNSYSSSDVNKIVYNSKELMRYGRYADVIINLNPIVESGWKSFDIYLLRAKAYKELGVYEMAIKDCTLSLCIKETEEAYYIRGICKYKEGASYSEYVYDLKRGGYFGKNFLVKIQNTKKNNNKIQNKQKSSSIKKKQLKKNPNFKLD